ncbi:Cupredoxin [Trichophaea hybrida]|nr:Cupredoxin [Trichophaea hybrida]
MVSASYLFAAVVALLPLVSAQLPRKSPVYPDEFQHELPIPPVKRPLATYTDRRTGKIMDFYEIKIKKFKKQLFPNLGEATLVGYDGIAPGPTFKVRKGRETVVRFVNEYDRPSAIHLHGSYSRAPFDGWAEDTIAPGYYKDYYYPNKQTGRSLWYHDHAVGITALNAYAGQAGFYLIEEPEVERRLDLPQGDYDIPLMFQSRFYTADGDISDISTETTSTYGDTFSVNGQILPRFSVEPRKYRFRMLNAAASRTFNFTLAGQDNDHIPFWVVGSDSGFLSHPVETTSLVQAMAERWEIVIDFSKFAGQNLVLKSAKTFVDEDYAGTGNVMQFRVGRRVKSRAGNGPLPGSLVDLDLPTVQDNMVVQQFNFSRRGPTGDWTINNKTFHDPLNRLVHNVPLGTTEKWILHGGGGWSHPVHIHLVDFQILERIPIEPRRPGTEPGRDYVTPYEAAALKDVADLGQNEQVTVLAKYAPWDGLYMFHCHNLVHEDHDMMAAFNVTALPEKGYSESGRFVDPMTQEFRAKPYPFRATNYRTAIAVLKKFSEMGAYNPKA